MGESSPNNATVFDPASFDPAHSAGADFYAHVNARWMAANPIPAEYGSWGSFHEVHVRNEELLHQLLEAAAAGQAHIGTPERMVGDYWAAGLDETAIEAAGIEPLHEFLDLIEGIENIADLASAAAQLRIRGIGILFGSYVSPDFEDSTSYLLYVGQGGLGLPERDYYFREDDHSTELRTAYLAHVENMLRLLGRDDDPATAAAAIVDLETNLAGFSYTPTELRDTELTTNKVHQADYAAEMPGFDLERYLSGIAGSAPTSINVDNPEWFKNYGGVMAGVPVETLRSYMRWHLIRATASSLSDAFSKANFEFYGKRLGGQREMRARWKRVLSAASADIGQQVSQLYVKAAFSADAKQRCESMVDHLLQSMRQSIEHLDWMGAETKAKALVKLDGFSYKIGYPDEWRDYSKLEIDRDSFVANRLRSAAFEFQRKIGKLGGPVDPEEWAMEPHAVNAYYHPLYNEIVFPAGILQPPFFWPEADDATNYGAIGAVIGHEITHGFDDQGSKFDETGNLRNWWTESDRESFEDRAAGLAEQYGKYEPIAGLAVNGELTLGENIADLGGVAIAYAAMRAALAEAGHAPDVVDGADGLTPEQRFFVSFATIWRANYTEEYVRLIVTSDPHSPGQYRCNGVLENFPPFAAAFGLDETAPLAKPDGDRIEIW